MPRVWTASPLEGEVGNGFALPGGGYCHHREILIEQGEGGTITPHPPAKAPSTSPSRGEAISRADTFPPQPLSITVGWSVSASMARSCGRLP
jgi:hypothetical protein